MKRVVARAWRGQGWAPAAVAAVAASLALGPDPARAQEPQHPDAPLTQADAQAALQEARAALAPAQGTPAAVAPARDITLALRDLALALPYLRGDERRQARALLARPPNCTVVPCPAYNDGDNPSEPFDASWSAAATLTRQSEDLDHFRIHWVTTGRHAASAQVLDAVRDAAEHAFDVQNGRLGWPSAKSDRGIGGNNLVDIYLADLCDPSDFNPCVFGYAATDPSVKGCSPPTFRCAAYLVLDNDYVGFDRPMKALRATLAHEYNHILQFRINAALDRWVFESTATWMEEHVFPRADDWVRTYIPAWARTSREPITDEGGRRQYGSAVWNHWLTHRFGADVVLDSWWSARNTRPRHFGVGAYERGISHAGGRGFSREFTRFAAATAEWRAGAGRFPDRRKFKDVRRFGTLRPGGRSRFRLDHTAYILKRVRPGNARRLRLRVRAPAGTRSGIALVGRRGNARGGKVVREVRHLARGGQGVVTLKGAHRFGRITAVIVNADGRMRRTAFGWRYARDNQPYAVTLRRR